MHNEIGLRFKLETDVILPCRIGLSKIKSKKICTLPDQSCRICVKPELQQLQVTGKD